jgi:hypothetical protein
MMASYVKVPSRLLRVATRCDGCRLPGLIVPARLLLVLLLVLR